MARRLASERIRSEALLLRSVPYREADLIVHLLTEALGAVSAIARGARKSKRRFAALEPMHSLAVHLDVSPARDPATLTEATVSKPRVRLISSLAAMGAAGRALRWIRTAAPQRTPEPALWYLLNQLLDDLDGDGHADALLAAAGLALLSAAGWGLVLDRCVRCGKPCPENARATVDVVAGGVVCGRCGGRGVALPAKERRASMAALRGEPFAGDAARVVDLVEHAFEDHGKAVT